MVALDRWTITSPFPPVIVFICNIHRQLGSISHFMLNIYCEYLDELKDFMSQLVHFDIVDHDDAQCFLVEARVESGFYLFVAGAVLLAILNTFVSKAAIQYLRVDPLLRPLEDVVATKQEITAEDAKDMLRPPEVLFSDRFRWFLRTVSSH